MDDVGVEQYLGCLGSAIFSSLDGRTPVSTKASSPSRLHAASSSIATSPSRFPPPRVPVYDLMYVQSDPPQRRLRDRDAHICRQAYPKYRAKCVVSHLPSLVQSIWEPTVVVVSHTKCKKLSVHGSFMNLRRAVRDLKVTRETQA